MEIIGMITDFIISIMRMEIEVLGYKTSIMAIMLWGVVLGLIVWLIRKVVD